MIGDTVRLVSAPTIVLMTRRFCRVAIILTSSLLETSVVELGTVCRALLDWSINFIHKLCIKVVAEAKRNGAGAGGK